MPKGPQGQKRPADAVARAVMVAQIATGEIEDDRYAVDRPRGSAGGADRSASLSSKERQRIAKAGAEARWKERSVDMSHKERLMAALFDNPQREHADIKFFVMGSMDLTVEKLCEDAADMLEQMDSGKGDTVFAEDFTSREASEFLASV
jgi:hypothetical protein